MLPVLAALPEDVHVQEIGDVFTPGSRRERPVRWREGLTAAELLPEGWDRELAQLAVDGDLKPASAWEERLLPGCFVTLLRAPGAGAGAFVAIVARAIVSTVVNVFTYNRAIQWIFPFPNLSRRANQESVYGWFGPLTNYAPKGLPVPVVYGQHRVGGAVVSAFVEVENGLKPQSYLFVLLLLSAGPIEDIGGISVDSDGLTGVALPSTLQINGNDAQNFSDITAHVRLGALLQEPMPGFGAVKTQYVVDLPINQVDWQDPAPVVVDFSLAATWDMPSGEVADRLSILLKAPAGFFLLTGGGALYLTSVLVQVRYQELDATGAPIGNAVITTGSGSIKVQGQSTTPFPFQVDVPLYDPDTFQPPQLSGALSFVASVLQHGTLPWPIAGVVDWQTAGAPIEEFSYAQVVHLRVATDHNPIWCMGDWNEDDSDPRVEGVMVDLRLISGSLSELEVTWGDGITPSDNVSQIVAGQVSVGDTFQVIVTWKRNVVQGQHRMRLYLDGALIGEKLTGTELPVTSYPSMLWNTLPHKEASGGGVWHGWLDHDDARLYNVELGSSQVAALHSSGAWASGAVGEPGLVVGFHFDLVQDIGGNDVTSSYHPSADSHRITMGGAGAPAQVTGYVLDTFGNTIRRARYRVDVQRLTKEAKVLNWQNALRLDTVTTVLDDDLAYPGSALLGLKILATDQISGSSPNLTVVVKGVNDCPVWDGADAKNPTFVKQWSASPFWQMAHHLLDRINGAGHIYDTSRIDWASLKEAADYSATLVYDQLGKRGGATDALALDYAANGTGLAGPVYVIRMSKPIRIHHVVGKTIRVESLTLPHPSGEYPEGEFTIGNVVSISSTEYEIWCDWPAGLPVPAVQPTADSAALLLGTEPRHECHLVLADRGLPFLEARKLFAGVGRATVFSVGDKVAVLQRRPRQPVGAFNAASIARGSFKLSNAGKEDRWNSGAVEFQDAAQDYQRNVVQLDHPSLDNPSSTASVRRKVLDMRGVVRASQVRRELTYLLNVNDLIKKSVEFEAGSDALWQLPGEVSVIAHPLPAWANGGRLSQGSSDADGIYPDTPVVMGTLNMLERVDELDHSKWAKASGAGSPPSVDLTAVAGPDGELTADQVTFYFAATNGRVNQSFPNRGVGFEVTGIVWLRLVSGPADKLTFVAVSASETLATLTPTLTSSWARFVISGTSTQPVSTDPTITYRLILDASATADVVVEIAWQRAISGPDDGVDAIGVEAVVDHQVHYASVVNPSLDNAAAFVATLASAGRWEAGDHLALAASLPWTPGNGWIWFVGPMQWGSKLFEATSVSARPDQTVRMQATEYNDAVFPDDDAFGVVPQQAASGSLTSDRLGPDTLPGPPVSAHLQEVAMRDDTTGSLSKSLAVSWALDPATAHLVGRIKIWVKEDGAEYVLAAQVAGSQTAHHIENVLPLIPGTKYVVAVQPMSRSGLARPLSRAVQASVVLSAIFPVPSAPVSARAFLSGDQATYEIDLPDDMQAAAIEVYRGGTFVGQEVGRIPAGGSVLGPTSDWCVLPAASDGRKSPPLYMRLVLPHGARGDFLKLDAELSPQGFPAAVAEANAEDGPWDQAGAILTELDRFASLIEGRPDRLQFDGASSVLTGTYVSPIVDLGRGRRVHLSAGMVAEQLPPVSLADSTARIGDLRNRSWTPQGHLDPGHPNYGRLGVFLEWAVSETAADPGTDYQPFRCGVALVRSCRWRIRIVRPDDTWDVWIQRFGYSIRPLPQLGVADWEVTS